MRNIAVLREELTVRKVGAQHQQRIAVHHRFITGRKADQAGHADVIRVVVFDVFLAAQRMHNRRFQALRQRQHFGMCPRTPCAAQQGHFAPVIEE